MIYILIKRHTREACGPGQHLFVARLIPVITIRTGPSVPTAPHTPTAATPPLKTLPSLSKRERGWG
jgi:hypothetical protein